MFFKTSPETEASTRCGIILAAGEGIRLRPFVEKLRGCALPKQYVNFIGKRSMLEHTFSRAQKMIPAERLFTVVSQNHLRYPEVAQQLSSRPTACIVEQPDNRDTGPGLLLPLAHLYRRYADSIVVVFPSDHFILEEDRFMAYVDQAFRVVEQDPAKVVLLGVHPSEAGIRLYHARKRTLRSPRTSALRGFPIHRKTQSTCSSRSHFRGRVVEHFGHDFQNQILSQGD
jgi:mannose-1-phosphate guanylyltransferase